MQINYLPAGGAVEASSRFLDNAGHKNRALVTNSALSDIIYKMNIYNI